MPPEDNEQPSEIPTEERAALEAGDFEQAEPGAPVGEPPWGDPETAVDEPLYDPGGQRRRESSEGARGWLKRRRGACGPAARTAEGGTCPTCGAPVERGQLVCLTCGGRVGLQYRRPPRWQVPVVLAAVVVVLAVVGVFVALQAASGDAKDEVAAGPASRQEAREPAKPARTETTTEASTPTTTETKPEPKTKTETETPAASPGLAEAKRGPVAVLSGVPEPGAAKKYARSLKRKGYTLGKVTNAPGGVGDFSVQYAGGSGTPPGRWPRRRASARSPESSAWWPSGAGAPSCSWSSAPGSSYSDQKRPTCAAAWSTSGPAATERGSASSVSAPIVAATDEESASRS